MLPPAKPTSPHVSSHHCSWALRPPDVSCLSLEYSPPPPHRPVCVSSSTLCDHPCPLPSRPPPVSPDRLCDRQHTGSARAEFPPRPRAAHLAPHGPLRSHLSCRLACPRCNTCAGGAQARGGNRHPVRPLPGSLNSALNARAEPQGDSAPSVPFLPQSRTSRVSSAGGWATPTARRKTGAVRAAQARVNGAATFWGPWSRVTTGGHAFPQHLRICSSASLCCFPQPPVNTRVSFLELAGACQSCSGSSTQASSCCWFLRTRFPTRPEDGVGPGAGQVGSAASHMPGLGFQTAVFRRTCAAVTSAPETGRPW